LSFQADKMIVSVSHRTRKRAIRNSQPHIEVLGFCPYGESLRQVRLQVGEESQDDSQEAARDGDERRGHWLPRTASQNLQEFRSADLSRRARPVCLGPVLPRRLNSRKVRACGTRCAAGRLLKGPG
jgi:hypothetical protein